MRKADPPNGPDFFRRTLGNALTFEDPLKYSTRPDVEPADQRRDRAPNLSAGIPRLVPVKLPWASYLIASSGHNVISCGLGNTLLPGSAYPRHNGSPVGFEWRILAP